MSELIVDQAMKVFYENSVIPKLEAKIRKLEKRYKKYKQLYKNAGTLVLNLDRGDYDICFTCMRSIGGRGSDWCKVCLNLICDDCVPDELTTNPCINDNCSAIVHKKCAIRDIPRACGHCNNCHDYCNCQNA